MNRYILLLILFYGSGVFSQNEKTLLSKRSQSGPNTRQLKSQSGCSGIYFTSAPNAFNHDEAANSSLADCLSYSTDLNAVLWVHQASPYWNFAGNSGAIQANWMDVATGLWDSTILYYDVSNQHSARYPNGTFYNPPGNSSISNASIVGAGPASTGSALTGIWYSARQLTGTSSDHNLPANGASYISSPSTVFGNSIFMNHDIQQVGTKVWVTGEARSTTTSLNPYYNVVQGGILGKSDFTSGNAVWSYDSIIPGYYFNNSGNGYASDAQSGRLAFGPDGMTGYWVGQGRLATDYGESADSSLSPICYKTTDGGLTWSGPMLPGYDWSYHHPELLMNLGEMTQAGLRPPGYYANRFKVNPKHGFDITVDASGVLHFVTSFIDVYKDGTNVDSLSFSYPYNHDYINYHPIIWDLMTDGSKWTTILVDSIMTSSIGADPAIDTSATYNPWIGNGGYLAYGARIQVSRSPNGDRIFYSWADSDPGVTGTLFNTDPDIYASYYDINSQKVPIYNTNLTQGLGNGCFFHYMSDISYHDNSQSGWLCPIVYANAHSATSPYIGADTIDYYYFDCPSFYDIDESNTKSAMIFSEIPSEDIENYSDVNLASYNYPNPFNQSTNIIVHAKKSGQVEIKISDVLGNTLYKEERKAIVGENKFVFDGSSLHAGVYYCTISSDGKKTTQKMILQK